MLGRPAGEIIMIKIISITEIEEGLDEIILEYSQNLITFYRVKDLVSLEYTYNAVGLIDILADTGFSIGDVLRILGATICTEKRLELEDKIIIDFFISATDIKNIIVKSMGVRGVYLAQELELKLFELEV